MKPLHDLNMMYSKVGELDEFYLFARYHFQIDWVGFGKNKTLKFTIENVWKCIGQCMEKFI